MLLCSVKRKVWLNITIYYFLFFSSAEMDLTQATAALAALIKYLEVIFENLLLSMV